MSIIDAAEWDACWDIVKAAVAWNRARLGVVLSPTECAPWLAEKKAKLIEAIRYYEERYGDKGPHDRPPA